MPGAIWNSICTPSRVRLPGGGDVDGGDDDADLTGRRRLSQSAADLSPRPAVQCGAVHVGGAAGHRRSRVNVFLHGMADEALRRQHRHPARIDVVLGRHTQDPAEVINVAVGVDHRPYRPVAAVLSVEREGGRGGFGAHQRVDDDDSGVALDESDVDRSNPRTW